jgi:hypothetical protein
VPAREELQIQIITLTNRKSNLPSYPSFMDGALPTRPYKNARKFKNSGRLTVI